ncbi:NepR family anti-sigma factor [Caulobacter sp. S45]|uniref:NepR family anti-sigma factor n=1 Tax=Caulobacter sp. S45 TaxID=1641861 RepID=UPI001576F1D8|nr:NepR family anti-sigma factor [Caulobacter sp. S45]
MKDDGQPRQPATPAAEPTLNEARLRQQAIGVKLRHMFDEIVNEPVPQDFLDILRRADDKGGAGGKG